MAEGYLLMLRCYKALSEQIVSGAMCTATLAVLRSAAHTAMPEG